MGDKFPQSHMRKVLKVDADHLRDLLDSLGVLIETRYSAKGTKAKWRYASSKARLKCATNGRGKLSMGIDETNTFQLKFFI